MSVDTNEFFREVTLRLCRNLEIEKGLQECVEYIAKYIPVDVMYLQRYEPELNAMRIVARARENMCELMDLLVPFDEDSTNKLIELAKVWRAGEMPAVLTLNKPLEEPVTRLMQSSLDEPPSSALSMPLTLEDKIMGTLVVLAEGDNRYNEYHTQLYATLKEPFFIAMSNTLKHREVLQLKDLLADDNRYLHSELKRHSGDEIIGANFGLKDVMHKVQHVAGLHSPVLLLGETGVGKDVVANIIHDLSAHSKGSFISVNCGAIPESLIDSELFGHEKGAFTGALAQKRGRFERADKGTIFLDEIGELPLQAQVRLLKVLQNKEIERVGGVKTISLDLRVIAATNRDLEKMVQDGDFREDLWFRLNVFPIKIPPLRERKQDIVALLQHFVIQKASELNLPSIPEVEPGSTEILMNYEWPGNVRELSNIVERAMIINPSGPLEFSQLITTRESKSFETIMQTSLSRNLDQLIASHIQNVVNETKGKIHGPGGAAEILGVNPSSLRNKMNKFGIKYGRSFES
ncbi:sigma 54-interacting transcriptional regulator [candidate division KSB1 bacterium]